MFKKKKTKNKTQNYSKISIATLRASFDKCNVNLFGVILFCIFRFTNVCLAPLCIYINIYMKH